MGGTVSWEEFLWCVDKLLEISKQFSDGWTVCGTKEVPGNAYLVKKLIASEDPEIECELSDNMEEPLDTLLEDDSVLVRTEVKVVTWEYHVLYSQSYSVPTLHFNAWRSDGQLLNLEEIWARVHKSYQGSLKEDRWSVLTQQEHPLLRRPFYMLHPCRTAEFLEGLKQKTSNILITWLSTFGPTVGLVLDPRYGQNLSSRDVRGHSLII